MIRFIIRRLFQGVLVSFGVVLLIFLLFFALRIDSSDTMLGQRQDVQSREAVMAKYGLDQPLPIRFGKFINALSPISWQRNTSEERQELNFVPLMPLGERHLVLKPPYLGRSFQTDQKCGGMVATALWHTLILSFTAIAIGLLIGIPLGTFAAVRHRTVWDRCCVTFASLGVSVPSYFSALILSFLLGYVYRQYTGLPMVGSLYDTQGHLQLKALVLPSLALGIRPVSIITQLTRSAMLDVLNEDFMRTARAKGLRNRVILLRHGLRNALNPVLTSVSGWFASLLAGAYFVEIIFDFKGMGYLTVRAIEQNDFPLIVASVLVAAILFVIINIVVDILYRVLDPRIQVS